MVWCLEVLYISRMYSRPCTRSLRRPETEVVHRGRSDTRGWRGGYSFRPTRPPKNLTRRRLGPLTESLRPPLTCSRNAPRLLIFSLLYKGGGGESKCEISPPPPLKSSRGRTHARTSKRGGFRRSGNAAEWVSGIIARRSKIGLNWSRSR